MGDFMRHNFKKLKIWQMAMDLAKDIFEITSTFPKSEEFGLKYQMNKCAVSMPSNIAEGSSRTNKSFSHFIDIALGSSFEVRQTQLLLANVKQYVSDEITIKLENKLEEFQRATMTFQNTLN
ncbi:MAG: four helix bundle protein [Flavobacterium sp.]